MAEGHSHQWFFYLQLLEIFSIPNDSFDEFWVGIEQETFWDILLSVTKVLSSFHNLPHQYHKSYVHCFLFYAKSP